MRAVVQRVEWAKVIVSEKTVGEIGPGLLALVCAEAGDIQSDAEYIGKKIAQLRIFADSEGKMNRDVSEAGGAVLLVSQFTLAGDARKGNRPSFIAAAQPDEAVPLLNHCADVIRGRGIKVETGEFGAHMSVMLCNDGPVTILLDSKRSF